MSVRQEQDVGVSRRKGKELHQTRKHKAEARPPPSLPDMGVGHVHSGELKYERILDGEEAG